MTDRQRNVFVLLVVTLLAVGSVVVLTQFKTFLGLDLKGGIELVYQGEPTPQTPVVTSEALSRAVDIMRQRVDQLGVSEPSIQTSGGAQIDVQLPNVKDTHRAEQEVGTTARLYFYDWEANTLAPNGKTVAGQLLAQDPTSLAISQGGPGGAPGSPGAGSLGLYQAVKLAASRPPQIGSDNSRKGNQYWLFAAAGSAACTAAKVTAINGRCLVAGPDTSLQDLQSGLPVGVSMADGQLLVVKQGTVVLQAAPATFGVQVPVSSPTAQFYVLRDHVALLGSDITNPQQSTDQSGSPDVSFGFTSKGQHEFQAVTGAIAHRGQTVSGLGQSYNQHFAVALDTQLITVPSIDYKTYPDGIDGTNGADITGGFTISSAQDLATQLRLGALPISLKLISEQQVSATLGKQALHQGLLAGLAGLIIVVVFLLGYYRVLGIIATAGLAVYALYFYALIKLIPVTLTLSGIAGLILTIGVAADANIVIFERVKEEIRAGRSIRQGIATGYRKGLTAIIDANVVTIMTAFILFVLATADVKGFAFTLGIGTFVSLFTAVLATQAILMTMGDSRVIGQPSALGAGGRKRAWRFDFMGASRYFFSLSGVILLIGALAVGGRGLNLGIDFTSGSRISVGLDQNVSAAQVSQAIAAAGAKNPTVQKVSGDATLGPYGFQISAKQLAPNQQQAVKAALQAKFGIRNAGNDFSGTSVGPTFGNTITNSAVIAIIASLLVITAYVALRFEWKFAIPVLIALMHDLLITSGVYALTGRQVTVDTVAALLTILGYSLYDTIIVFDRVRENIPRMPRAAFSQIVNRSMAEVLTRSVATTSCTLMPVIALLLFGGGGVLGDFAFALLIGVASGAYSSIFIASPVLTHWKEREAGYRARRRRIIEEYGSVPPYAAGSADVDPLHKQPRRTGRLTQPAPDAVSAAEFEQMKRDLGIERESQGRHTSTLTKRLAHTEETDAPGRPAGKPSRNPQDSAGRDAGAARVSDPGGGSGGQELGDAPASRPDDNHAPAPDIAENEGVAPVSKPARPPKQRPRNRRHGRRR
ncbi:MAG: protein translocase subunit SecD [Solirubrobacteraceae bacterium]